MANPTITNLQLDLNRAHIDRRLLEECFTAVLRGSLDLTAPHVSTDVDAVTHIDYWAVNLDRGHGGIVLAVRRVAQPDNQPATVSVNVQFLDTIRERYRSGSMADPHGRLHYEKLMSATGGAL
jgi:hypothetical protein